MKTIFLMLITLLVSCRNESVQKSSWVKPDSVTIGCEDYFAVATPLGVLTNNVWNKHAAKDDDWSQCLEKRMIDGKAQFGWSWSWPFDRKVIYAQPQIKVGASPWAPEPKFDSAFPLKISELKKLDISHSIEVSTNGDHNTATTLWLITEEYKGTAPNKSVIAAEIMIWTYATAGHFNPAGRKFDEVTVDDTTWEVWYQKDWDDKSGVNDNQWVNVSFRAKQHSMSANIPGLTLLAYAINKGIISDSLYVADVELGNEIMSGAGVTWIKSFSVDHETKY